MRENARSLLGIYSYKVRRGEGQAVERNEVQWIIPPSFCVGGESNVVDVGVLTLLGFGAGSG